MQRRGWVRFVFASLLLASAVSVLTSAQAHRSGCHRWHSCPSDSGSYTCGDLGYFTFCGYSSLPGSQPETSQPSSQSNIYTPPPKPSKPKVVQPSRPRYAVPGVAYIRAGSLNGTMGYLSKIPSGWYQLTIKKATMQVKPGSKTAAVWVRKDAPKLKSSLKSAPILLGGQLYLPVSSLRLVGCLVDTSPLSAKYVEVTCGSTTSIFDVKIW